MAEEARTFQCDQCKGVFTAEWSEDDALAEKKELWGDYPLEKCARVCDDCFQEIMAEMN